MDGDTGFRGMVDVHSHFRALFAADLVIGEFKTRLLTALYETKTLFFIFPEIIVRQPEKENVVGAVLAEFLKFREKSRKIFIPAHRITVYDDGVTDGSIRKHSIDRMTEIQTFVILQREIGAWILTVKV